MTSSERTRPGGAVGIAAGFAGVPGAGRAAAAARAAGTAGIARVAGLAWLLVSAAGCGSDRVIRQHEIQHRAHGGADVADLESFAEWPEFAPFFSPASRSVRGETLTLQRRVRYWLHPDSAPTSAWGAGGSWWLELPADAVAGDRLVVGQDADVWVTTGGASTSFTVRSSVIADRRVRGRIVVVERDAAAIVLDVELIADWPFADPDRLAGRLAFTDEPVVVDRWID